jgi:hypothetical protein
MPGLSTYWSDLYRKVANEQTAARQGIGGGNPHTLDIAAAQIDKAKTSGYYAGENDKREYVGGAES